MIKNCFLNCLTLYGYMDPFPDLIVIYRFISICELLGHTVCDIGPKGKARTLKLCALLVPYIHEVI